MNPLSAAEITAQLTAVEAWTYDGKALVRTFDCHDFEGSMAFVNAVADLANRVDHHPSIQIDWNHVTISTWSHDANGITSRDFALVTAIDAL